MHRFASHYMSREMRPLLQTGTYVPPPFSRSNRGTGIREIPKVLRCYDQTNDVPDDRISSNPSPITTEREKTVGSQTRHHRLRSEAVV